MIFDFILTNAQICKEVTEKQNPKHTYQRRFCVGHYEARTRLGLEVFRCRTRVMSDTDT